MKGQKQVEVLWDIETQTQNRPTEDVIFKNSDKVILRAAGTMMTSPNEP